MIIILIVIIYSLIVVKAKFTPVVSTLTFLNRNILSKLAKKLFKKKEKPSKFADVEDAFTYQVPEKKLTKGQKNVDKAGDEISKIIVEIGKVFAEVDKRVKFFFIALLNVFFVTGLIYHIIWACRYWELSLSFTAVFIEWITWIKANTKPTEEPVKK